MRLRLLTILILALSTAGCGAATYLGATKEHPAKELSIVCQDRPRESLGRPGRTLPQICYMSDGWGNGYVIYGGPGGSKDIRVRTQ